MICSASSRAFESTRSLSWLMRRACLTSSGIATRSWSMRSRTAACSRMTWLVMGTFLPFTTRASIRSTRNCMSTSPSRSEARVPQEKECLLADLFRAHDTGARRRRMGMLLVKPRHHERMGGKRGGEAGVRERRIGELDVGEGRVAEHEIERLNGWLVQERQDVRLDD